MERITRPKKRISILDRVAVAPEIDFAALGQSIQRAYAARAIFEGLGATLKPEVPKEKPLYLPYTYFATEEFQVSCERTHFFRVSTRPEGLLSVHPMLCKARRCEQCGFFWSWKWRLALRDKKAVLELSGMPAMRRAITLTTAYPVPYKQLWLALKYFWRYLRTYSPDYTRPWKVGRKKLRKGRNSATFPYWALQYWGVVEVDQKTKEIPHLHFIIYNPENEVNGYIDKAIIKLAWQKAQKQAGFTTIAWDTRIERIRTDVSRYFTKYLTKLEGGKDEIPPETWGGRYVRYSMPSCKRPGFFSVGVAAITTAHGFAKWLDNPQNERSFCLITQKTTLPEFIKLAEAEARELDVIINERWSPWQDVARSVPWAEDIIYPLEVPPKIAQGRLLVGSSEIEKDYSDLPLVTHLSCPWHAGFAVVTPDADPE